MRGGRTRGGGAAGVPVYATGDVDGSGSMMELVRNVYPATVSGFPDHPATARTVLIKALHITELRTRIDTQRIRFGLLAFDSRVLRTPGWHSGLRRGDGPAAGR
jgi:hypothetical protein